MSDKKTHLETLGTIDSFRAPWETEGGEDAEIDKGKLKRLIFNLKSDYAKARDAHEETKSSLADVEAELQTAKTELASANGEEASKKIASLEAKVEKLTSERDGLVAAKEEADLRAEVLGGLDPKYAKYVTGATREELEKSLESVKADFGLTETDGDEDEDEDEPRLRTRPRALVNPLDPKSGDGSDLNYDPDKVADQILGAGSVFG